MNFMNRRGTLMALGLAASGLLGGAAMAQEVVTLRLHQFLPGQATIPAKAIAPWAKKVEAESGGKIKIQMYNTMQLGGTPPQLFDQARDGVVDLTWTVLGYTPGRFPKTEVFELPFITTTGEASSRAIQEYVETHAADEFKSVKLIAVHTHGPGLFHTKNPIAKLEDLKGMKIRGGSRIINNMLTELGATPVGMPVHGGDRGLVQRRAGRHDDPLGSGACGEGAGNREEPHHLCGHPWSVQLDLCLFHEPGGLRQAACRSEEGDRQQLRASKRRPLFGRAMDEGDKVGRGLAEKAGNNIVALDAAETQRWRKTAADVETTG